MADLELHLPPLHPGQLAIWNAKERFKVVICGRRWGKTMMGTFMCIAVAVRGGRAWWVAPTYPVGAIGWRFMVTMLRDVPHLRINASERRIEFPNGGVIQVKSADNPDSLRGESLDLVVMDEFAQVRPDAWFEALRPALADRQGSAMFIGTPKGMDNWAYDLFLRCLTDDQWVSFQRPTLNNPYVPPEEVAAARKDLHPSEFAQEFEAEFIVQGGTVFQPEWERYYRILSDDPSCYDELATLMLTYAEDKMEAVPLKACPRFITADLATSTKTRADFTVLGAWAVTPGRRACLMWIDRRRMEGPDLVPAMLKMQEQWKTSWIGIESSGFQLSIVQQARREGLPVRAIPADKDKYARALNAGAAMESSLLWYPMLDIPHKQELINELRSYPEGRNDDCVDMVGYAASTVQAMPRGPQLGSF